MPNQVDRPSLLKESIDRNLVVDPTRIPHDRHGVEAGRDATPGDGARDDLLLEAIAAPTTHAILDLKRPLKVEKYLGMLGMAPTV